MDIKPDELSQTAGVGESLLAACRLVGEALGETIVAPPMDAGPRLEDILRLSKLRSRSVLLRDGWWRQDNGPLLAFIENGCPVALLPDRWGRGYALVDPRDNRRRIVTTKLALEINGNAIMLYRKLPDAPVNLSGVLAFSLTGTGRDFFRLLLAGLSAALLNLFTPVATCVLIDSIIPGSAYGQHLQLIAALTVAAIGAAGFEVVKHYALVRIESRIDWALQAAVFDRLLRLSPGFFRNFSAGDLSVRTLGIQTIRETLSMTVVTAMLSFVFSLVSLGFMFYYSWQLALIGFAVAMVLLLCTAALAIAQLSQEREQMKTQGQVEGLVLQYIAGVGKLRVAAAESRALAVWAKLYQRQKQYFVAARTYANIQELFQATVPLLTSLLIFIGVLRLLQQDLVFSAATFLAFNAALGQFMQAMIALTQALTKALSIVPLYERCRPVLDTAPESCELHRSPIRLLGGIEFRSVNFRYSKSGPPILKDVSFAIQPGEFIAVVGPSGSGKSTLIRLLLGFEQPEQGEIVYDGKPLGNLDLDALRAQMGVVLQNGRIVAGSMYSNIAGTAHISREQAMQAARTAGLADDIEAMPMGLDTVMQEGGSTLSGGQRQRLLLARALARSPALLLLDEATSALDNQTQLGVMNGIRRLSITRMVVAHRLSTIVHADRILVMQHGRIVQSGSYDQLIEQPGLFAELAKRQLK